MCLVVTNGGCCAEKDWVTPSTFSQVPVRYDVNGTQLMANGTLRRFHRVYDFFDFMQDFDSDPTVFEVSLRGLHRRYIEMKHFGSVQNNREKMTNHVLCVHFGYRRM